MDRILERHPLSALWGDMPSDELAAMRESVQDHGFTDPVIWTCDGAVLDGWHRYTIANLLSLDLEVREYSGDPVQLVIAKNLRRRHLTAVQRSSYTSACIDWAKQGQQKSLERDKDTGQFTIGDKLSPMDDPITKYESEHVNPEADPEFFTQSERASLADVSESTQDRSDRYENAGLGPEIRSGAISGAEAERRVRDPDTPRPLNRVQQLEMKLEAKTLECQTEHLPTIDTLQRELREAKAQVSEYPHEREAVANEREAIISAQPPRRIRRANIPCRLAASIESDTRRRPHGSDSRGV